MRYCFLCLFILCFSCKPVDSQKTYSAGKVDLTIREINGVKQVSGKSSFTLKDHFVWCGATIQGEDGKYYLFYSAMDSGEGMPVFTEAWVLGSKLGVAVSDFPEGDFKDLGFFYNADGYANDTSLWDAQTTSNTHIQKFNNKYYLYYVGSCDPGENAEGAQGISKRNRVQQNQKIGVITFNTVKDLLSGNFVSSEQPLLSPRTRVKPDHIVYPSSEGTVALPDNIIVVNPSVVYRPSDKKYLLYFKGNIYDPHWRGVHGVAISDTPEGPFVALDQPVFHLETAGDEKLSAEDPYVWYNKRDKLFYAVFKDFTGEFTKGEPALAIMYSEDGFDWKLPENSMFMKKELVLTNDNILKVDRLERPQLLLDENDDPIMLYAACAIDDINNKNDGSSFNVHIPIKTDR